MPARQWRWLAKSPRRRSTCNACEPGWYAAC